VLLKLTLESSTAHDRETGGLVDSRTADVASEWRPSHDRQGSVLLVSFQDRNDSVNENSKYLRSEEENLRCTGEMEERTSVQCEEGAVAPYKRSVSTGQGGAVVLE
jgi:hypothetical protein